ncbi:MAG: hypothetical protein AB1505_36655, partial [Candidatus Latescibacterota bacterium]
ASLAAAALGAWGLAERVPNGALAWVFAGAARGLAWVGAATGPMAKIWSLTGALMPPESLGGHELLAAGAIAALVTASWALYEISGEAT